MDRTKRVSTPDDWFPTADDGKVDVSIVSTKKGPNRWSVVVSGDDDFHMILNGLDITTAFDIFLWIKDGITQKKLSDRGFVSS